MAQRPLILVTNDDGVTAQGIQELTRMMRPLGDVVVVAPDSARSGAACSISPITPVRVQLVSDDEGLRIFRCSGTPCDCVKVALEKVVPRRPDLLVSGINHGDNASISLHYSGTIGAVIEGCLKGVPSIAYSLRTHDKQCDFRPYEEVIVRVARQVLTEGLPTYTCLNVNFPQVSALAGSRVCRMARGDWRQEWADTEEPGVYTLTGYFQRLEPEADDTDYWAIDHGYAAITPLTLDATNHALLHHRW